MDDPVFGTTKTAPEKGNKKPPPPAKAAKPEPPAKKVKAPAPAPAKNVKASKVSPRPPQLTRRATLVRAWKGSHCLLEEPREPDSALCMCVQPKKEVVEEKAPELPAFSEPSPPTSSSARFRDSLKALTPTG